ncbi:MAG: Ppx/GppA family phosphatase [bacterium]
MPGFSRQDSRQISEQISRQTCAAFDIGSHSVKMLVAERATSGGWRFLADRTRITRLGADLAATGAIGPEPSRCTLAAIAEFLDEARDLGVHPCAGGLVAVGTMCLRNASNAGEFLDRARREYGLEIEIIPGEEEARLAYLAVTHGLGCPEGELIVFDVGGGSTEFIFGRAGQITERFSLDVGALRLTAEYLPSDPVPTAELERALVAIATELKCLPVPGCQSPPAIFVGMGGTITNLGAIKHQLHRYESEVVQGTRLDRAEIAAYLELFRSRTVVERRAIVGLEPDRADVILAGCGVVAVVMDRLEAAELAISDHGVRHGLLHDRFST